MYELNVRAQAPTWRREQAMPCGMIGKRFGHGTMSTCSQTMSYLTSTERVYLATGVLTHGTNTDWCRYIKNTHAISVSNLSTHMGLLSGRIWVTTGQPSSCG